MDWITIGLLIFLLVIIILIATTLYQLMPLGDERKRTIQLEAGSYSFLVVVVYLLIEIIIMAYTNLATSDVFSGLNPLTTLIIFSLIYLFSLWKAKRKYS